MLLATRSHVVGDRRRYVLDYGDWLATGTYLVSATATSSSATATVDTVSFTNTHVVFFVSGGVKGEVFTVSVDVVDSQTQVKNDTVQFTVVAP